MKHVILEEDGEIKVKTGKLAEKIYVDARNKNAGRGVIYKNSNYRGLNADLLPLARMTVDDVFAELFKLRPADKFYYELVETSEKARYAGYDLSDECVGRAAKQFRVDDRVADRPKDVDSRRKKILCDSSPSNFMESVIKALSADYMVSSVGLSRSYCRLIDKPYKTELKKALKKRVTKEHIKRIKKTAIKRTVSNRKLKNAQYQYTGRIENSVV